MNEEVEALQLYFDNIKGCGQIFSAIVLFDDLNAYFNYGESSSPNIDIGIRVFKFFLESNISYQLEDNPRRITQAGSPLLT